MRSSWQSFHREIEYLSHFAHRNLFPKFMVSELVHKFLNNHFQPKHLALTAPKQQIFLKIPFLGLNTAKLTKILNSFISKAVPYDHFTFIPINNFSISSFFSHKDYTHLYKCAYCNACYVGQTGLQFFLRNSKQQGISYRTASVLTSPENSSIRNKAHTHKHPISLKTLASSPLPTTVSTKKKTTNLY